MKRYSLHVLQNGVQVCLAVMLVSCTVAPRPHEKGSEQKTQSTEKGEVYREASATISYYDQKFTGRKTASGERYDPHKHTAAHKSLPFGTKVQVTNPETKKAVTVRVNDRGPFVKGRDLDISQSAAAELGIQKSGVKRVKIEVLGKDGTQELAPPATPVPEPGLTPVAQ